MESKKERLNVKAKTFNKNYKRLEKYLAKKGMFLCGISKDFERFPIFKGYGVNDPNNKYVGYANNMCEIDSIVWNK